ncbi:hypothetical protein [Streptomyces sp. NPDC048057]|uniref:hypothetical protein n=1 Tax=Streptomyces sp. NPDC048057 TaxID=3155628 RepID=UPI0033CC2772
MRSYAGSGPYCYNHSLAMTVGAERMPSPTVLETLTGSPFGVQLIGGTLPMFDPYGWDPELGLNQAVDHLGLSCLRTSGGSPEEALARLREAAARGPVLVGPLDMGLLLYRPGTPDPGFGDHYVVVLSVDGPADGSATVLLHDPQGHPYATTSGAAFVEAWRGEKVTYIDEPFVMRTEFVREREVTVEEALRASLPGAVAWLAGRDDLPMPEGTLGGAAAVEGLAEMVARGLDPELRQLMADFVIRVGTRRLSDAADCLAHLGLTDAARVAAGQARTLGSLQEPLVTEDDDGLRGGLARLAPGYETLRRTLAAALD